MPLEFISIIIHTEFLRNSLIILLLSAPCKILAPFFISDFFQFSRLQQNFSRIPAEISLTKATDFATLKKLVNLQCILFLACQCNMDGSEDGNCASDGQCSCKENIAGAKCDQCQEGYSMNGFPTCQVIMPIVL